jgi:hypothetical protein
MKIWMSTYFEAFFPLLFLFYAGRTKLAETSNYKELTTGYIEYNTINFHSALYTHARQLI